MKIKIDEYLFDASAKTVRFLDYNYIDLERILLITNVTDNIIIYNFADTAKGGTVSENVLTLDHDTTSMDDDDDLLIFYQEVDDVVSGSNQSEYLKNIENSLSQILIELKKMNIQFEIFTDTKVEEGDL
jgi:hypothetical protein